MEPRVYYGIGQYIRDKLVEAGNKGVVCADLYSELNELRRIGEAPPTFRRMRLHSFYRYFHWLTKLEWVEPTNITEVSYQKGGTIPLLVDRRYYKITKKGLDTPRMYWANPLASGAPDWGPGGEKKKEYMREWWRARRTGRPPGRPRKTEI